MKGLRPTVVTVLLAGVGIALTGCSAINIPESAITGVRGIPAGNKPCAGIEPPVTTEVSTLPSGWVIVDQPITSVTICSDWGGRPVTTTNPASIATVVRVLSQPNERPGGPDTACPAIAMFTPGVVVKTDSARVAAFIPRNPCEQPDDETSSALFAISEGREA